MLMLWAAGGPAPAATPAPAVPSNIIVQTSWGSQHEGALYLVQILFVVTVIGLIGLMAIQTTKTEGLSGSIGGRMESAYKGRLGIEQQLARLTAGFAVAFMALAILDFLMTR